MKLPCPAFILSESRLRRNLQLMQRVQQESGADIILAFKGFAMWRAFPLVREYLPGATASSLYEARLCFEEMGVKAHSYCVAYPPDSFDQMLTYSSHMTFNSLGEWQRYKERVEAHPAKVSPGLRVNPGWSDVDTDLYNPSAEGSRLGIDPRQLAQGLPEGIEGLHVHVLCESSAASFEKLTEVVEEKFYHLLPHVKWMNFGGGHLMTRQDYEVDRLIHLLKEFKNKWDVEVILEPGSAVAWETGILTSRVLDLVENHGVKTAILDVSFTNHMPDTLEMPYRPQIRGVSQTAIEGWHPLRIGGVSCLAGDVHQAYFFPEIPKVGDVLIFEDMIHYTTVKTNMFNGLAHPAIAVERENGEVEVLREFGYEDYRDRMN